MYVRVPPISHSSKNLEIPLVGFSDASGGGRSPPPLQHEQWFSSNVLIRVGFFSQDRVRHAVDGTSRVVPSFSSITRTVHSVLFYFASLPFPESFVDRKTIFASGVPPLLLNVDCLEYLAVLFSN